MIHHQPDDIRGVVEARFPDVTVGYASTVEAIGAQLDALKPEAVFSIQDARLPGKYHHQAVTAPSVQWVQVGGSGYEQMQPYDPEKIVLTNSAGILARHLAQTVTGAMIALNGNFFRYRAQQHAHTWAPIRFRPLVGQTLLVVGLGQIGDWVAKNAKALGMTVHAVRRRQEPVAHVDKLFAPEQLHAALGDADVVSLHVRANDDTRHMFSDAAFAAMKPGSFFLNTARGMVCDTAALIAALDRGHVAGAYLDVFEEEPLPATHALWDRDDVFIMPHSSDHIVGWETAFTEFFADNLERWCAGAPLVNTITG
ncbi:MAG: D-2-hydroxyacid dehydrogenase [Pseudomonadota bacterium]